MSRAVGSVGQTLNGNRFSLPRRPSPPWWPRLQCVWLSDLGGVEGVSCTSEHPSQHVPSLCSSPPSGVSARNRVPAWVTLDLFCAGGDGWDPENSCDSRWLGSWARVLGEDGPGCGLRTCSAGRGHSEGSDN
ncbi:hypothetical protein mRhiFer1_009724 [Rhinolophus ferrumequinum]|uniref:Uncharacterized protein n=1 Tax=Rhinolophus ferrumequinum TaxID=59479 RepID=A0A7J7ZCG4_RHIFE|nr:hypothetical protein mRhiFer1_009724 [Rhinolophus ferrumequinum]